MSERSQLKLEEYYNLIRSSKHLDIYKMKDEAEELLRYSHQYGDTYGQAFAFLHLTIYYITLRRLDSARFNLAKAKTLCSGAEYVDLLISCYFYEGIICQLCGDKIKAIGFYGKAKNLAVKQKDDTVISFLYNNIAIILMDYNDMELAKEYFELAADKLTQLAGQSDYLVQVYANLVYVCCALHDMTAARRYFGKAKTIDFDSEKAASSIKASEVRLYTEERDIARVEQAYAEYLNIIDHCKVGLVCLSSDILAVTESLLLADLKENCRALLIRLEKTVEQAADLEIELQLYKLYIKFQEKYAEQSALTYKKYYDLLMQSEAQEYSSLAESLRGRIKLSEMSQNQSALAKKNETLQKQAHLDEMTGAFNRRYFDKLLLKINEDCQVQTIGCIMLDVDYFKEYNDSYGHLQGDQILKQVVEILTKHALDNIYVGRFGGDEFYCLCAGLQDAQIETYLTAVYDDLRTRHIAHCTNAGHVVTLSAGFCNQAKAGIVLSEIMDCADQALYAAKNKGRNGFVKYKKPCPSSR